MRAGLQIRVSTLEQAIEGYSLAAQEKKLREYAKFKGYEIVGVYRDDGYSGASLNRPGLRRLMSDIEADKLDIVLIYKQDRLTRSVKDLLNLLDVFDKHNVALYSITENIDLSSPFGRAALKMSATFSELERETIIERSKMGKDQKARQGELMGSGNSPFGYKYDKLTKRFEIVPEEAEIVRNIYSLYIRGMSIRQLNAYCRDTYNHPHFGNPMSCKALLHRPMYAGYFEWKGDLIKGVNFDPIITYEDYLKVQNILKQNTFRRNRLTSPYMLTGLLVCGDCGNRYVGKYKKSYQINREGKRVQYGSKYYGCTARIKRDKNYHPAKCSNKMWRVEELDEIVLNAVKNIDFADLKSPKTVEGSFDLLRGEIADAKNKIDKLLDLYMNDLVTREAYEQRLYEYEKRIKQTEAVIEQEQEKLGDSPELPTNYLKEQQARIDELSLDERRLYLKMIIKHIVLKNDEIYIEWRIK